MQSDIQLEIYVRIKSLFEELKYNEVTLDNI